MPRRRGLLLKIKRSSLEARPPGREDQRMNACCAGETITRERPPLARQRLPANRARLSLDSPRPPVTRALLLLDNPRPPANRERKRSPFAG